MCLFQPPYSGEISKSEPLCPLHLVPIPSEGASKATSRLGTHSVTTGILILSYGTENKHLKIHFNQVLQEETTYIQDSCLSSHI